MTTAVDMLGQEYGPGDHVVYATTSGRSPVIKYAEVQSVTAEQKTRTRFDHHSRERFTEEYTEYKVGVKEIKNGRNFYRYDAFNVRTTYPMANNIVKVSEVE